MEIQFCLKKKKKKTELEKTPDASEKKDEKEESMRCTLTDNRTGPSDDHPQNVVTVDQDTNAMLEKPDKHSSKSWIPQAYKRNVDGQGKRQLQASLFSQVASRHQNVVIVDQERSGMLEKQENDTRNTWVPLLYNIIGKHKRPMQASFFTKWITSRLQGQQRDTQSSPATTTRETVESKSSSPLKPKKKGRGRNLQALTGSSSRSVPRKRNRKSGIEEIEDAELDSRRWTYLLGKNDKSPLVLDHAPTEFDMDDAGIGYEESLLKFSDILGRTAQSIASKKLKLLSLAQATTHGFQAQVPHLSRARGLPDYTEDKSVIVKRGGVRNSFSAADEWPKGPFDKAGIQRPANVFHRAVRESVQCPTHNHSQLIQQQPPNNAAAANAYTLRPGNQVRIAFEARPRQNEKYSSTNVWPSRFSTMCHASSSGYRVRGGHHSTPLNELQRQANPSALVRGFQESLHNSHMQSQNQLGSEVRQQQQMALEQQPLPMLSNMFYRGTSHAGTSFPAPNHHTTSNAAPNGQQMPLADRSYQNLELQLGTKPLSPRY